MRAGTHGMATSQRRRFTNESLRRRPRCAAHPDRPRATRAPSGLGEHRDGFRDHLIFSIAFGTGLREHEILALDVGDVFDEAGRARRRVALRVFKRSNPYRSQQQVLLNETIGAKLEKYRSWKRGNDESLDPSAPLFLSRNHRRLSMRGSSGASFTCGSGARAPT